MNVTRVTTITAVILIGVAAWMPASRSRRVSAQSPSLSGAYGFSIAVPYIGNASSTGAIQGSVIFDGAGNVSIGSGVTVGVGSDPNATVPQVQPLQSSAGTYTVNPDGTGTITLQNSNGKVTSLSFVMTDGGSQLMLVVTAGIGNVAATGIARKQ